MLVLPPNMSVSGSRLSLVRNCDSDDRRAEFALIMLRAPLRNPKLPRSGGLVPVASTCLPGLTPEPFSADFVFWQGSASRLTFTTRRDNPKVISFSDFYRRLCLTPQELKLPSWGYLVHVSAGTATVWTCRSTQVFWQRTIARSLSGGWTALSF